jgi:hypothetical protein
MWDTHFRLRAAALRPNPPPSGWDHLIWQLIWDTHFQLRTRALHANPRSTGRMPTASWVKSPKEIESILDTHFRLRTRALRANPRSTGRVPLASWVKSPEEIIRSHLGHALPAEGTKSSRTRTSG